MKKLMTLAAVAATICFAITSCYAGPRKKFIEPSRVVVTEDRTVAQFSGIDVQDHIEVVYVQTNSTPSITVKASDNLIKFVYTEVKNGILKIKFDALRVSVRNADDITVYVSGGQINTLSMSGATEFEAERLILDGDFKTTLSGACELDIENFVCKDFMLAVSGAGKMSSDNVKIGTAKIAISGAGEVELEGVADVVDISITGAGNADFSDLRVGKLNQAVTGAGRIRY